MRCLSLRLRARLPIRRRAHRFCTGYPSGFWSVRRLSFCSDVGHSWANFADTKKKPIQRIGFSYSPNGSRTRVTAVRGQRPRPLDDRAVMLPVMGSNHHMQRQRMLSYH
jgi:hypothetical protein